MSGAGEAAGHEPHHRHRGHRVVFTGADGNRLVASRYEADAVGAPAPAALLLHGGGQTRHAWSATAARLAAAGFTAIALDLRGHGDSDWVADGAYAFSAFARDVTAVADAIALETGRRPAIIGASLGGLSGILALGARADLLAGLILVDITPKMNMDGVAGINRFMMAKAYEGFGSIEEAADAVAAYLPHRPRPKNLDGLRKNLRQRKDGRFYWHWDPRFFDGPQPVNAGRETQYQDFAKAARSIRAPLMLVRGRSSELVGEDEVEDFRRLCPQAEYADIAGARHMVAGDKNDVFARTILEFMTRRFKNL